MRSTIFQLIVAGHDTTTSPIGTGTVALVRHPEQRDALVADPGLVARAVEECLRWDAPVPHSTFRYTTEEVRIGEVAIPAFAQVIVALAAANRDPARYRDPESFDIHRADGGHLALGHGIHHCLAPLARMEAHIALTALHTRSPPCASPSTRPRCTGPTATGWCCAGCPSSPSSSDRRGSHTPRHRLERCEHTDRRPNASVSASGARPGWVR